VLAATLLTVVLTLLLPRKYLFIPVMGIAILTPFGAQLFFGGFHFFPVRILALVGMGRLLLGKLVWHKSVFAAGVAAFDKIFIGWAVCRGVALMLLHPETGAIVNQVAFWVDTLGLYILFRHAIRDLSDIVRGIKVTAVLVAILAACMVYEHRSHFNVFNLISTNYVTPVTREGDIRAQASFGVSITAGTFAATAIPLFFWLWKSGQARTLAMAGFVAALAGTYCSKSSTPATAALGAFLGLSLWPIRAHMRKVRWGIVLTLVALALVMKAPIFYIIAKVDFVGGHGWDRAFLVEQFAHHFFDWWLIGTDQNANWGYSTWDRCNQYIAEAASGGLITLVLFIALLSRAFGIAGRLRKRSSGNRAWLAWCMGSALLAHVIAFQGVSYWDQMRVPWLLFVAVFPLLDRLQSAGKVALQAGEFAVGAPEVGDDIVEPSPQEIRA
jgi:hypothetical protein